MSSEELYDDKEAFDKAMAEYAELKPKIAQIEGEWLELSEHIEAEQNAMGLA